MVATRADHRAPRGTNWAEVEVLDRAEALDASRAGVVVDNVLALTAVNPLLTPLV